MILNKVYKAMNLLGDILNKCKVTSDPNRHIIKPFYSTIGHFFF